MLLDRGVSLDNRDGVALLVAAAGRADVDLVHALLAAGVDVNARSQDDSTPLMEAAWRGDPGTVDVLLAAGADVDAAIDGSTAADVATAAGAFEIADRLRDLERERPDSEDEPSGPGRLAAIGVELEAEAERDLKLARDGFSGCVEHIEARSELPQDDEALSLWDEMEARWEAQFLADHGYPQFCSWDKENLDEKLAELEFLRRQEWQDPSRIAASPRAAFKAVSMGGTGILDLLLDHGLSTEAEDDRGRSLLELAVEAGDLDTVTALVAAGARVETVSELLELAVSRGAPGVVRALLEAGADYQATMDDLRHQERGSQLSTCWSSIPLSRVMMRQGVVPACWVLVSAVNERSPAHVRMIASAIDDVNCIHQMLQQTPLFLAIEIHGERSIVEALLAAGADPDRPGYEGWRPLHHAAFLGQLWNLERLLQAGADVNATSDSGATALHLAALEGDVEGMALLLEAGAMIDATTLEGATPLMEAVRGGSLEAVELLLHEGAEPWLEDSGGQTAFDLAVLSSHLCIAETLAQTTFGTE